MSTPDQPFQLLYVSELSPGTDVEQIDAIALTSRRLNHLVAISGALLFDGSRFSQLLEGREVEVRSLMMRITVDSRHFNIAVTASGYFGLPRLTVRWQFGTCDASEMSHLAAAPRPTDEVALASFMSLLAASKVR